MKKFLLKSLFLLCALVVGSQCGWALTHTIGWGNASGDNSTNFEATSGTVTNLFSFSTSKNSAGSAPAYNSNNSDLRLYYASNGNGGSITITPSTGVTITGFSMVTTTTPSVKYSVNDGTATSVSQSNNTYTVSNISATTSLTIQNVNTTNTQLRISTIAITYTLDASSITAVSNNDNWGTVMVSGDVITATPKSGYRINKTTPYEITSGSSNVSDISQNNNTFTVTTSGACSIRINFEAIPSHIATFYVNGNSISSDSYNEDIAIVFPSNPSSLGGKSFVGWKEGTGIASITDEAPTVVSTAVMGTSDVSFFAVFATITGSTPSSWTETTLDAISASDIFVISTGSYAMTNNNGTTNPPSAVTITVAEGKMTSIVTDNLKWQVSGNTTDGYTFYPNGSTTTWLYCTTTASSGSNNNIRVGTGDRKLWEFDSNGYLITKDSNVDRYLSIYSNSDFRGYISTDNGAFVPKFYKYFAPVNSYVGYCTDFVLEATSVEIDATSITNTELYDSNIGGFIKATVYNSTPEAIDGAKVSWSSSDKAVATIGSDGSVTLIGAGTTTITASYAGGTGLAASEDTYNLTVTYTNPNAVGTVKNPYTVAQARAKADEDHDATTSNVYVKGIVSKRSTTSLPSAGYITYFISDDGEDNNTLQCYQGMSFDGAKFSAISDITVGQKVVVKGDMIYYNDTYPCELTAGSELVSKLNPVKEVGTDGWATYITTANIEFEPENAFVVRSTGTNIVLSEVTQVPSGTPLVLKGEGKKYAAILTTTPAAVTNLLEISDGAGAGTTGDYVLGKKDGVAGFYKWNGGDLSANKVYLPAGSAARDYLEFSFDNEETTGVNDVRSKMSEVRGEFYNLAGQRVAQPTKGLYIVNRRKVVVK